MITVITAELISNVSGYDVEDYDKLKSLDLHLKNDEGKIHSIQNMHLVPNLLQLNLSYNSISRMDGLECLHHLIELNLAENMISKLECLNDLKMLEKLNLSGNQIQRIPSSIANLKRLTHLRLARNKLDVITDLLYLKPLSKLCSLRIDENPISKLDHCRFYVVFHLSSLEYLDGEEIEVPLREEAMERYAHDAVAQLEQTLIIKQHQLKRHKRLIHASPSKESHQSPIKTPQKLNENIVQAQKLEEDILLLRSQIQDFYKKSVRPVRRSLSPSDRLKETIAPLSRPTSPKNLSFGEVSGSSNVGRNVSVLHSSPQLSSNGLVTPPPMNASYSLLNEVETLRKEKVQYQHSARKHIEKLEEDLEAYQQQIEQGLLTMQALNKEYSEFQILHNNVIEEHKVQMDEIAALHKSQIAELEENYQYAQAQWDKERLSLLKQFEDLKNEKIKEESKFEQKINDYELLLKEKDSELLEHKEVLNKLVQDISSSSSSGNGSSMLWSPGDDASGRKGKTSFSATSSLPYTPIPISNTLNISQHPILDNFQYQQYQQKLLSLQEELSAIQHQYSQLKSQYDLVTVQHSFLTEAQEQWKTKERQYMESLSKCEDTIHEKQQDIRQQKLKCQELQFQNDELQQECKSLEYQKEQLARSIEHLEEDMNNLMKAKQVVSSAQSGSHTPKNRSKFKQPNGSLNKIDQVNARKSYFEIASSESSDSEGLFGSSGPGIMFPQHSPNKSRFANQNSKAALSSIFSSANQEKALFLKKKMSFSPLEKHAAEIVAHVMIEEILHSSQTIRGTTDRTSSHGNGSELILWNPSSMKESCLRAAIRLVHFSNNMAHEAKDISKGNPKGINVSSSEESGPSGVIEAKESECRLKKDSLSTVTPFELLGDRKYLSHLVAEMQAGLVTIEDSNAYKTEIEQLQKIIHELERKAEHTSNTIGEKENVVKTLELHADEAKKQALDTLNEIHEYHQKLQNMRNDHAKIEQEQILVRQQYELQQKQLSELIDQKHAQLNEIQQKQEIYISLQQSETRLKQSLFNLQEKISHEEKAHKQQKLKALEEIQELTNQINQNKLLSQKQEELFTQNKKYSVQYEEELLSKSHQLKQHLQSINSEKQELLLQIASLKQELSQLKVSRERLVQEQQTNQASVLHLKDSIQSLQVDYESRKAEISRLEETKKKTEEKVEKIQQEFREEKRQLEEKKLQLLKEIESYTSKKQDTQLQYEQLLTKHQHYVQEQIDLRNHLEQQVKTLSQEQQDMSFQVQSLQYEITQLTKRSEDCMLQNQSQERNKLHFANQKHLLEKQISQQQRQLQQLKSEITDHQVTLQQQKSQVSIFEQEIANKQQSISQIESNITQLQSVEQRLSNSIQNYYRQSDELLHQINQNKHCLQCEEILVKEKQNLNSQLQEDITDLERKKSIVQDELKQMLVSHEDLEKKLSTIEVEYDSLEKKLNNKTAQFQSIQQQKQSVEEEILHLQRNITKSQQYLSNLQDELQSTKNSLQQSKQQMLSQSNQVTAIQEEYNTLLERLHEHQAQQQVLLSQQSSLLHENKVLEQQKNALFQQIKTSEKQLQSLLEQVNQKENNIASVEHSLKLLESTKQDIGKTIQLEQLNLNKLQESKEKTEENLWKLHDEIRAQQEKLSTLQVQQQQDEVKWQQQRQQKQHQLLVLADSQKRLAEKTAIGSKLPFHTSIHSSVGIPVASVPSRNVTVNTSSYSQYLSNNPTPAPLPVHNRSGSPTLVRGRFPQADNKMEQDVADYTLLGEEVNSVTSQDDTNSALSSGSQEVVLYSSLQQAVKSLRQQSAAAMTSSSLNSVTML